MNVTWGNTLLLFMGDSLCYMDVSESCVIISVPLAVIPAVME
jgi:hypothetical protein